MEIKATLSYATSSNSNDSNEYLLTLTKASVTIKIIIITERETIIRGFSGTLQIQREIITVIT